MNRGRAFEEMLYHGWIQDEISEEEDLWNLEALVNMQTPLARSAIDVLYCISVVPCLSACDSFSADIAIDWACVQYYTCEIPTATITDLRSRCDSVQSSKREVGTNKWLRSEASLLEYSTVQYRILNIVRYLDMYGMGIGHSLGSIHFVTRGIDIRVHMEQKDNLKNHRPIIVCKFLYNNNFSNKTKISADIYLSADVSAT